MSTRLLVQSVASLRRSEPDPHELAPDLPREVDENGDFIFRFRLSPPGDAEGLSLEQYYEELVRDLLRIVRFYHEGKPLLLDAFAFRNAPDRRISLRRPSGQVSP